MKPVALIPVLALLLLAGFPVQAAPVVIVKATTSAPNDAERSYAESIVRRIDRWLGEMSVPRVVVDDSNLGPALKNARVAILAYNPNPGRSEIVELASFISRGGKVIVFYSAEPELAKLMKVRLGKYMTGGAWRSFKFTEQAPPALPNVVAQESKNIRPIYPAGEGAKVIAYWQSEAGQQTAEPAWVQSSSGMWMSHILLDDGDTAKKRQMLVAMIGSYDPSIWPAAALRSLTDAVTLNRFSGFEETREKISARSVQTPGDSRVRVLLNQAAALHSELLSLHAARNYGAVVQRSQGLRALLTEAYASAQSPRDGEFRAVWNRFGSGLYPGDWDRTCRVLASHGITDVIPFVVSPAAANYNSAFVPTTPLYNSYGDQLKACVEAAHKNGLKVHAWKICWKIDGGDAATVQRLRKQGRMQVTDSGATLDWLCPSDEENLRSEKDAIREIVKNYAVDGIHLDYIRYNDGHTCFCGKCRAAYERDTGKRAAAWPPKEWSQRKPYYVWRCGQITRAVRDMSAIARNLRPGIKISAAVYGRYPTCVEGVGQDWLSWIRKGYVDFVLPMNYVNSSALFTQYVRDQLALPGVAGRIYPGIGVTATESRLDAVEVVDQVAVLRREGAPGFALFELNRVLEKEILPALSCGLTRK